MYVEIAQHTIMNESLHILVISFTGIKKKFHNYTTGFFTSPILCGNMTPSSTTGQCPSKRKEEFTMTRMIIATEQKEFLLCGALKKRMCAHLCCLGKTSEAALPRLL